MEEWVKVGTFPQGDPELPREVDKWLNVAEDMALIPERNVRARDENDQIIIEVSIELYNCMRGI